MPDIPGLQREWRIHKLPSAVREAHGAVVEAEMVQAAGELEFEKVVHARRELRSDETIHGSIGPRLWGLRPRPVRVHPDASRGAKRAGLAKAAPEHAPRGRPHGR